MVDPTQTGKEPEPPIRLHQDMPGVAGETSRLVMNAAKYELVKTTERFSRKTKISGASFVLIGIQVWWNELRQENPSACADLFRAMADLAEARTHEQLANAEDRRRDAVDALFRSLHASQSKEKSK